MTNTRTIPILRSLARCYLRVEVPLTMLGLLSLLALALFG